MIYEEMEKGAAVYSFEQLSDIYRKNDVILDPNFVESAMALLAQSHENLLRLRGQVNTLESEVADYRARESMMDVVTLRAEIRALKSRVESLETSLKLLNS